MKQMPEASLKDSRHVYTVSELTQNIKLALEDSFAQVWVEGEVSGISRIATGTTFFSLKDTASLLKCVIFPSHLGAIKFEIKDGLKVICFGRVSVYEKSGQYQLYIERVEPKGVGSLQLALEQLKEKLEKEGLFAPEHKKPIPYLPSRIGVVTSLSGAAIKDILKVLDRRFSGVNIVLNPVRVQGEGAKEDIAQAIKDFNRFNEELAPGQRIGLLIVGRGGGSIEDLWAFNEEIVARAIYHSRIPVISAVGHERDWTIADLVADLRAATPSVAAELAIPEKDELKGQVGKLIQQMQRSFLDAINTFREDIEDLAYRMSLGMEHVLGLNIGNFETLRKKLAILNPASLLMQHKEKIEDLSRQIQVCLEHFMALRQSQLSKATEKLCGLSPLNILARGYSITFKASAEEIIKDAALVKIGDHIRTRVHKGEIFSAVTEVKKNA